MWQRPCAHSRLQVWQEAEAGLTLSHDSRGRSSAADVSDTTHPHQQGAANLTAMSRVSSLGHLIIFFNNQKPFKYTIHNLVNL